MANLISNFIGPFYIAVGNQGCGMPERITSPKYWLEQLANPNFSASSARASWDQIQLQCEMRQKWVDQQHLAVIKIGLPNRCSLCVSGHHGDCGGSVRDKGGAAMSCGCSAPRRRRGVLGKRRTISVWLPQCRDPPSCWSGNLQEVQQVRSLFNPGHCLLWCHTGGWWSSWYLAVYRFSLLSSSSLSLSISNLRPSDSGFFHCRVLLPGLFNDQTATLHLIITHCMLVSLCHNTRRHTLYCLVWRKINFIWQYFNNVSQKNNLPSKNDSTSLNFTPFDHILELNVEQYCRCCAII